MLFLLSPAKSLDFDTPVPPLPHTLPRFPAQTRELVDVLRTRSPRQVAQLMDLSDALATLNAARYQAFRAKATERNARQAVLAFNGDVYEGLDAWSLQPSDLEWAQDRVRILSGLYGVLRPLDWIQPHRLEMGTQLPVGSARNLYQYWGSRIAETLDAEAAAQKVPVVVNLASQEYFRAVDRRALRARVIECVFEEWRGTEWKVISFSAKQARGRMARFAITQRIDTPRRLEGFQADGYAFDAAASQPDRLVFRRRSEA